jgi:uncharacterized protein YndB with AHSA1/START domain
MTAAADSTLEFIRIFNAPRELVFSVWTQPEHVLNWWGPTGFSNTMYEMEVKPGGIWRFMMHGPNGVDYPNRIVFLEVVKPEKLVYKHGPDSDDDAGFFDVTVLFEALENKTKLTMRMQFKTKEELDMVVKRSGAMEGNKQTMDKLEKYLEDLDTSDREIVSTRVFNAPIDRVYQAWTNPKHLAKWWGPKGFTNTFHEFDLRTDGVWAFVMHSPDGHHYPNRSIFVEIVTNEKIVFDHISSHPFRVVATFEDLKDRTKVTFRMIHPSAEECEQMKVFVVPANEENFDRLEIELTQMN